MLYLVKVNLEITQYMCDESEKKEKLHIVEATTEDEAEEKVIAYYDAKTSDYSVYYRASVEYINEAII